MTDMYHLFRGVLLALCGSVLLTGCLFTPGKFGSQLALYADGSFEYTYEGEVVFLLLTDFGQALSEDNAAVEIAPFCYDEETGDERDCTEEEIAQQNAEEEERLARAAEREQRELEEMQRVLGFDPSDPEAGNQIAEKLQRQAGWDKVTYRGEGIFDVSYSIKGMLTHDYAFPTIEGMSNMAPFLAAYRRDGNRVRVDAPAFTAGNPDDPSGMMGGMGLMAMGIMGGAGADDMPNFVAINGTFAIVTDGQILANNTDEGPEDLGNGTQRLTWRIDTQTKAAPTALIGF